MLQPVSSIQIELGHVLLRNDHPSTFCSVPAVLGHNGVLVKSRMEAALRSCFDASYAGMLPGKWDKFPPLEGYGDLVYFDEQDGMTGAVYSGIYRHVDGTYLVRSYMQSAFAVRQAKAEDVKCEDLSAVLAEVVKRSIVYENVGKGILRSMYNIIQGTIVGWKWTDEDYPVKDEEINEILSTFKSNPSLKAQMTARRSSQLV